MTGGGRRWLKSLLGLAIVSLVVPFVVVGVAIWMEDEETVTLVTSLFTAPLESMLRELSPAEKALIAGATIGNVELVERGVLGGASPDTSFLGNHALFQAATDDHHEVLALLLRHGADIDKVTAVSGRTALHEAALRGHLRSAQLLVDHGANVNARNAHDRTPLYYVVSPPPPLSQSANWEEMKVLLLHYGAGM